MKKEKKGDIKEKGEANDNPFTRKQRDFDKLRDS